MENKMIVFKNLDFGEVRTVIKDGSPWFVGKDVCSVFEDTNHNRSLGRIDACDKSVEQIVDSMGRKQNVIIINESGLYSLLFSLQPQKANNGGMQDAYPIEVQKRIEKLHSFKRWVTHDVLPDVRKCGVYMTPEKLDEILLNPDAIIKIAMQLKEERLKRIEAESKIEEQKPLVEFANHVSSTTDLIDMGTMSKLARKEGIDVGRTRLMKWLREKNILMNNNIPYQRYIEQNLFKVKETTKKTAYGIEVFPVTLVTGKGQIYIIEKLRKEYLIL